MSKKNVTIILIFYLILLVLTIGCIKTPKLPITNRDFQVGTAGFVPRNFPNSTRKSHLLNIMCQEARKVGRSIQMDCFQKLYSDQSKHQNERKHLDLSVSIRQLFILL